MFRRLGITLTCLALFLVAGGHWAVLQSVAWAGMLNDYSQADGLVTAVQKTFSGDFPCAMCVKIDDAKKQETEKPPVLKADKKVETFLTRGRDLLTPPPAREFCHPRDTASRVASRSDRPPCPVPILA